MGTALQGQVPLGYRGICSKQGAKVTPTPPQLLSGQGVSNDRELTGEHEVRLSPCGEDK